MALNAFIAGNHLCSSFGESSCVIDPVTVGGLSVLVECSNSELSLSVNYCTWLVLFGLLCDTYELWWNQFALHEQQIYRKHPKTSAKPTRLMYIGDGLNRLTHLHTAYITTLTRMMTAIYKLSRYGRMDDLGT